MNMHCDLPRRLPCDSIESWFGRAGARQTASELSLESCDMFGEQIRPRIGSIAQRPTTVSARFFHSV